MLENKVIGTTAVKSDQRYTIADYKPSDGSVLVWRLESRRFAPIKECRPEDSANCRALKGFAWTPRVQA